nr:carbonic anhydrase-like protein 1 [Biomphalaria glabrata]
MMDTHQDRLTWQSFRWLVVILISYVTAGNIPATETWSRWWSYDGISGPNYWGKTNPDWKLCKHGKQQSPINIEPSRLLFDPNLKHLKLDSVTILTLEQVCLISGGSRYPQHQQHAQIHKHVTDMSKK